MILKFKKGGVSILGSIVLAIFTYVVLKVYFHINLEDLLNDQVMNIFHAIIQAIKNFWQQYLSQPAHYLWNTFLDNMQKIHDGQPTDLQTAGQNLILPN